MRLKSSLDLINECDNFPYHRPSHSHFNPRSQPQVSNSNCASDSHPTSPGIDAYWHFRHNTTTLLGYIHPRTISSIDWDPQIWSLDTTSKSVELRAGDNAKERSQILAGFLQRLREKGTFRVLDGWRGEVYPIYGEGKGEVLMSMERAATPLFGVLTYGVHMTGYVRGGGGKEGGMKIWVPRRVRTKQTYPGMMDNTVAGGLTTGERAIDCLVREAREEASLPEKVVRENAKACGTVTYFHVRDERAGGETRLCQPECQYVYDLELSADVVPIPDDNEAEDFRLLTVDEVKKALGEGKFKPNCALVLLDFFFRHGILTPENESDYIEVVSRLHRRLEFPTP